MNNRLRQDVIFTFIDRYLRDTSKDLFKYGIDVVEHYWSVVPDHDRSIEFHPLTDTRANAQMLRRYIKGEVRLPVELEESLVMALADPYRSDCLAALSARYGLLAAPVPLSGDRIAVTPAELGDWTREFGEALSAFSPMLADGVIDTRDRRFAREAIKQIDDVIAKAVSLRHGVCHLLNCDEEAA